MQLKKIPYGLSDFKRVKTENYYFVDKTHFLKLIEDEANFLYFLRPRRFGKSLTIAMIEAYFDVYYKEQFDAIFKDTYAYDNPTPFKSSFYILSFNFSAIDTTDYENSFRTNLNSAVKKFINKYNIDLKLDFLTNPIDNIRDLLDYCMDNNIPIYILIDEYDNFINKLLVNDITLYKGMVTDKEAIYKEFFSMLKVGTTGNDSAIRKMFITGVSPLALFDVTSGNNIGKNISLDEKYNDMVGVTQQELKELINYYGYSNKEDEIIQRCTQWYNNYRFNEDVEHTIYNSDMILYYMESLINTNKEPKELIDVNVRTDYTKLKYLVYTNKKLNGNFDLLNQLIQGELVTTTNIKTTFSAFEMLQPENFKSFLFSLGFLTLDKYRTSLKLSIPNQTIKKITAEFIQSAYRDISFNPFIEKFNHYLEDFGFDKDLKVFHYLADEVKANSVIRDYIDGENFIKGFLIAYFSLNPYYEVISELELNKGFADITLNPSKAEIPYGALIELKYIPRSKYTEKLKLQKIQEAKEQLKTYDIKTVKQLRDKPFVKIVLVYNGWEMVVCEEV